MDLSHSGTLTLLDLWKDGQREAFDKLLGRKIPFLRGHARKRMEGILRGKEETHDIVQAAAIRLMQYCPPVPIKDRRRFHALLRRVVENTILDRVVFFERHVRDRRKETSFDPEHPNPKGLPHGVDQVIRKERIAQVRMALDFLPPLQRQAVVLSVWYQVSNAEIASELELNPDRARRLVVRGLQRLVKTVRLIEEGRIDELMPRNRFLPKKREEDELS